ncbi:leucine-rich repeat-containing protein 26 [Sceloporus undulatus]|uniref:leucine-rich repeat-containing protein 26 n=1 Tax=Sceloporus undulatus TaxID=8520 RepID=UPI001C4D7CC2|nr:leucine-rich repeat-containing protein 26 [Sceloporus undulatus]
MAGCRRNRLLLSAAGSGIPSWRGPRVPSLAIVSIALLLPLSCLSSGCPEVCSCSTGEVNCMDHRLRFVPDGLPTNATAILLDYNRISSLRNRTFVAQEALLRLSLRSNLLVSIHRQALAGLSQLQELDLSGNYLSLLQPETFLPLPSLRTLNLGNNRLLRLEPELVGALPRLQSLSVQGNALASLGPGVFENLPSLLSLKLGDNPWACSCGIQPLFQWLMKNVDKVPEVNAVSCKRPEYLSHHPIIALGNGSFARCQEPWLQPQDYAFFLLVGPSTFFASICVCILAGLLAVACQRMAKVPHIQPGALARRAERHPR